MKLNQQLQTIYTPYCYLIGWTKLNKYYYGVRYAKKLNTLYNTGCHPDDLWKTYFTSSSYVKEYRSKYGEPDLVQIRKIFNCSVKAARWETKVISKLLKQNNNKWLNKNTSGCILWDDQLRERVSGRIGSRKGKTMQEMRPGWVNPIKGKKASERYKDGWVCYRKGKKLQEIWGTEFIDPRSKPFKIISKLLGISEFKNVQDCMLITGLDGISIIKLKRGEKRLIKRRSTTKHIYPDSDVIYIE